MKSKTKNLRGAQTWRLSPPPPPQAVQTYSVYFTFSVVFPFLGQALCLFPRAALKVSECGQGGLLDHKLWGLVFFLCLLLEQAACPRLPETPARSTGGLSPVCWNLGSTAYSIWSQGSSRYLEPVSGGGIFPFSLYQIGSLCLTKKLLSFTCFISRVPSLSGSSPKFLLLLL